MTDRRQFIDIAKSKVKGFSTTNYTTSPNIWMEVNQVMRTDVAKISSQETVALAAMTMADKNISCIVATDGENVTGILTETDLLKKAVVQGKDTRMMRVAEIMSSPVETAPSDLSVLEAGNIMEGKKIKRLPILDGKKLVGIVTQTDLTRVLTSYGMWRDISEIMSDDIYTIQRKATIAEAAEIMASQNISSIVVMDADRVTGVLTERDLFKRVVALNKDSRRTKVEEVMSFPVFSIPPNYSVFSTSRTMENKNVRRLVVIDGRKLCGIVTQTDIFKAVKDKIQAEEETILGFMDESKIGFYMTDLNHLITYVNPAFVRLFEASGPQEFMNREFLHERFWLNSKERAQFLSELDNEFIKSKEISLRTSEGKKIYVTIFSSPTTGMCGQINGYQGIVYNITEKKELSALRKAEEALRESERKWRSLAENVPDIIVSVDKDGIIQFINRYITGYDTDNVIGKTIYEYISSDQHEKVRSSIERVFLTGKPDSYEINGPGEHGPYTNWETRVIPVTSEGQVITVNLISTDITERMESQNRQANLLERVQKINRELNDFAHIVSHDLKEPLRTLKITAKWLSDDYKNVLDENGKEYLKLLSSQITQMYELIEGVLKYSRTGHLKNQKEWIDLKVLMPQIINMVSTPDNIEITIDGELPVIEFERTQIAQVFQNLLSNAIKYIDKPLGQIRIGCVEEVDNWKFSVTDNGIGIEPKNFEKIFLMYQTLEPRDTFKSTGIGLTLVKKIIETYGGTIWVESELGRGSTFIFTIPKQDNTVKNEKLETGAIANST
jgi:two-component system sensor kinase FixL